MRAALGIALIGVGGVLLALALLFLVGAGGLSSRYVVAAVGLTLGVGFLMVGARVVRRGSAFAKRRVADAVLSLAQRRGGEVSLHDLAAELGERRAVAEEVLADLEGAGQCRREVRDGQPYFVFEALLPRILIRRCQFCAFEGELARDAAVCPRCGGDMRHARVARTVDGDVYSMDD